MADDKNQKAQPAGYNGENPATAGPEQDPKVNSNTPENKQGTIDPTAPNRSTNESGDINKDAAQGLGSVGYGGENKPMSQPDGTSADLEDETGGQINAGARSQNSGSQSSDRKSFRCVDVGYTECNWHVEGSNEQEILPKIKDHASKVHHLEFKPEAEQNVHRAIRDAA
jgi:predicted small metal-binding protein